MKNLKKIRLPLIALIFAISSCSVEDPIGSQVTVYPDLNLIGDRITVITEGLPYTDPGATSTENGEDIDIIVTGTADPNTPGVYKIDYQSFNSDGFSKSLTRTVIVLSSEPSSINLEGTFYRGANANIVTRISDRVYVCDNAAGYARDAEGLTNNITLTFYNIDDTQVYAPFQTNTSPTGLTAESNIGTIVDEDHWSWVIFASAFYGTAERIFSR